MIHIKKTVILNSPIEKIWKVLFKDFTKVGKWATGVYDSRPGTKEENYDRVCKTFTGTLYENIVDGNKKNHSFSVSVKGLPFFIKDSVGSWKLKKISKDSTEANFEWKLETKGIIGAIMQIPMKSQLEKAIIGVFGDLQTYVKNGKVSESKQKEMSKQK